MRGLRRLSPKVQYEVLKMCQTIASFGGHELEVGTNAAGCLATVVITVFNIARAANAATTGKMTYEMNLAMPDFSVTGVERTVHFAVLED